MFAPNRTFGMGKPFVSITLPLITAPGSMRKSAMVSGCIGSIRPDDPSMTRDAHGNLDAGNRRAVVVVNYCSTDNGALGCGAREGRRRRFTRRFSLRES